MVRQRSYPTGHCVCPAGYTVESKTKYAVEDSTYRETKFGVRFGSMLHGLLQPNTWKQQQARVFRPKANGGSRHMCLNGAGQ